MTESQVSATPLLDTAGRSSRWTAGRIAALVSGAVLALFSLALLGVGGTALWADVTQREAGYVTTGVHEFSSPGAALATEPTELGSAGVEWLYGPGLLGKVRIRVTPADTGSQLFVGIARSADAERYLAGVNHTVISEFFGDKVHDVGGGAPAATPGEEQFWAASSSGPGTRTVVWKPSKGSWTVVVMNADGHAGVGVGADLGARFPAVLWIAIGLLLAGAVFLIGGGLLIASAFSRKAPQAIESEGRRDVDTEHHDSGAARADGS